MYKQIGREKGAVFIFLFSSGPRFSVIRVKSSAKDILGSGLCSKNDSVHSELCSVLANATNAKKRRPTTRHPNSWFLPASLCNLQMHPITLL